MYDGQPDDGATFNKRGIVVARPTYVAGRPDGPSGPARAGALVVLILGARD